jgi:hypothetical protein
MDQKLRRMAMPPRLLQKSTSHLSTAIVNQMHDVPLAPQLLHPNGTVSMSRLVKYHATTLRMGDVMTLKLKLLTTDASPSLYAQLRTNISMRIKPTLQLIGAISPFLQEYRALCHS